MPCSFQSAHDLAQRVTFACARAPLKERDEIATAQDAANGGALVGLEFGRRGRWRAVSNREPFSHRPRRRCPDFRRAPARRRLRFLGAEIYLAFRAAKIRAGNLQTASKISIRHQHYTMLRRGFVASPRTPGSVQLIPRKQSRKIAVVSLLSKQTWPPACLLSETRFCAWSDVRRLAVKPREVCDCYSCFASGVFGRD